MKGRVVYTVGLPGSGKSTWAKGYVKGLEEAGEKVVRIELDDMREEFGLSPDDSSSEGFQNLLAERHKRITSYLSRGFTVVLSDTNLTRKARKAINQLALRKDVKEVLKQDFTHVPLGVCIQRDLERKAKGERYLGEKVIRSMYQLIRPNDPITTHEKCLVVGDVHGDYTKLTNLLSKVGITQGLGGEWINPHSVFVVFLGDLNDPRLGDIEANKTCMSSLKVIQVGKALCDKGWGVVLQSNHGLNLVSYLKGRRTTLNHGLEHTAAEFSTLCSELRDEYLEWLTCLPYFYSFFHSGKKITCVHAQYTKGMNQYNPCGPHTQAALYGDSTGVKDEQGYVIRRPWWEEDSFVPEGELYISGHYHKVVATPDWYEPRALVLDGNCGCDGGKLVGYYFHEEGNSVLLG